MTDPIPTMSETGTTWTRAKFLAEIADMPQLAKYVPAWGPMPGVPIADVVAMLREARARLDALVTAANMYVGRIQPDGESNYQLEAYYAVLAAIAYSAAPNAS